MLMGTLLLVLLTKCQSKRMGRFSPGSKGGATWAPRVSLYCCFVSRCALAPRGRCLPWVAAQSCTKRCDMSNRIWANYTGLNACTNARGFPSLGSESNDRTDPRIESRDLRSGRKSLLSAQFSAVLTFGFCSQALPRVTSLTSMHKLRSKFIYPTLVHKSCAY